MNKDNKVCASKVIFALIGGAGIAASAFLVARKVRKAISPTAERLIKKCDKAFAALDSQIYDQLAL